MQRKLDMPKEGQKFGDEVITELMGFHNAVRFK